MVWQRVAQHSMWSIPQLMERMVAPQQAAEARMRFCFCFFWECRQLDLVEFWFFARYWGMCQLFCEVVAVLLDHDISESWWCLKAMFFKPNAAVVVGKDFVPCKIGNTHAFFKNAFLEHFPNASLMFAWHKESQVAGMSKDIQKCNITFPQHCFDMPRWTIKTAYNFVSIQRLPWWNNKYCAKFNTNCTFWGWIFWKNVCGDAMPGGISHT